MQLFMENLRSLDPEKVAIRHHPLTKRYTSDLRSSLPLIIKIGRVLGWRTIDPIAPFLASYELVLFTEPYEGKSCGSYVGARFHYSNLTLENVTVFCFYNGKDKSPCFVSESDALSWMNNIEEKNNFRYERGSK
jgi:hypothetical protein